MTAPLQFWRTLEEFESRDRLRDLRRREFPSELPEIPDPIARRTFLKLMAASMALAGITGCTRQPSEQIVPYVRQPEELVPGNPLFYASAMALGGTATGILVESHEGRPTKIEGNPLHPASLGATDLFAQAAILDLYDPDRPQTVTFNGDIRPWSSFLGAIRTALAGQQARGGGGIRLLTQSIASPTMAAQLDEIGKRFPTMIWHQWDPMSCFNRASGSRLAFGEVVDTQYRLDRARIVLSLDADFLASGPGHLRYARDFARRRRTDGPGVRLYAVESTPTLTGARADHRLSLRPSDVEPVARMLAAVTNSATGQPAPNLPEKSRRWIEAVGADLVANRGTTAVIAGDDQPPVVHAAAHAINAALGNTGQTVFYTDPVSAHPIDHLQSLKDLCEAMNGGTVELLVIVGGNPVFTAPADFGFKNALGKVPLRIHLSPYFDETSEQCHWHLPEAHFLEAWSDARSFDGTASIVQPLIAPLYGAKSSHELLAAFGDRPDRSGYDIVREFWQKSHNGSDFDQFWRRVLHDGVVPGTSLPARTVSIRANWPAEPSRPPSSGMEIVFRNDPTIGDGRFANNGWLQELPKPLTSLTWDNAIVVSPATAARLQAPTTPAFTGGEHGQLVSSIVEVRSRGRTLRGPIFALPGHPDGTITVHAGYGRTRSGRNGTGRGVNSNAIRTSSGWHSDAGAEISVVAGSYSLACTQYHHLMEGRDLVRVVNRDSSRITPGSSHDEQTEPTLYSPVQYTGYKWGMAIDLNACIGCNACVVACQAENNIPIVGKEEVLRGREMHWLRVDTYYEGAPDSPRTYFQPVPCMQCEQAPCEVVCPVGATVHSAEGLNDMVYNRCVGTRYCSNNCPYKVRRFNFLLYQDWETPSLKLGRNPNVSVRSRGVMEKCTYCVQRINAARIHAEEEDRRVRDGEIKTACQAVCPAEAIVFGDLNDSNSKVAALKREERNYALLAELNTRPRTTYLAAIVDRNPNLDERA